MQLLHCLRVEESLEGCQKRSLEISCSNRLPVEHCERRAMLSVLFRNDVVFLCLVNLPTLNIVLLCICLANTCLWFSWQSRSLGAFNLLLDAKSDVEGELFALHLLLVLPLSADKHRNPLLLDRLHALHSPREAGMHILVFNLHPPIHIAAKPNLPVVVAILPQSRDSQWSRW